MDIALVVGLALVLALQVTLHIRIARICAWAAARFNSEAETRTRAEADSLQEGLLTTAPAVVAELREIVTELRTLQREWAEKVLVTSGSAERPATDDDPEQRETIEMMRPAAIWAPPSAATTGGDSDDEIPPGGAGDAAISCGWQRMRDSSESGPGDSQAQRGECASSGNSRPSSASRTTIGSPPVGRAPATGDGRCDRRRTTR